ncbi:MAG TPA: flippase-like domain-containing protein [Firmicutes bacterium]|nr:flippase-like domain-containing protein [Bacillota bacterium]
METAGRARNIAKNVAGAVLLSLISLVIILHLTRGSFFLPDLFRIDPLFLGAAAALVLVGWLLDAVRLIILLRALGGRIGFLRSLAITLTGAFVAGITPFDTGGEPLQIYLLHQDGITLGESTAVIAMKVLLSSLARLFLGSIIPVWLFFSKKTWDIPPGMSVAISTGLLLYALAFGIGILFIIRPEFANSLLPLILRNRIVSRLIPPSTTGAIIERVRTGVLEFRGAIVRFMQEGRWALAIAIVTSLLGWAVLFSIPVLLLRGLGIDPPYAEVFGIISIFYLAAAYAPTPGSSGAMEVGFAILLGRFVPFQLIGVFVAVWRFITYYLMLLIGGTLFAIGIGRGWKRKRGPGD